MIKYKSGYRHQLYEDYVTPLDIYPDKLIITRYISLFPGGNMMIKASYAWDGPSGPCRWIADRLPEWLKKKYLKTILTGSLVHDALCQLERMGLLDPKWAGQINKEFKRINLKSGMSRQRAWWTYISVEKFGAFAMDPKNKKPILTAP